MKNFRKYFLSVLLVGTLLGMSGFARANFYEESCQTIRLHGQIQAPADYKADRPLELTLAYQMNFQTHPAYLKINLPLGQNEFQINFVGFRKREPGDLYIPMMFWYPRSVKFQYYVKSPGGNWISETHYSTYTPALTRVEEEGTCTPDLFLDPLVVKRN